MSTPPPLPENPFATQASSAHHQAVPQSDGVFGAAPEPPPQACVQCGSSEFSTQTKLPVCEGCRTALVKYPFPLWIKMAAAVVAVLVIVSLVLSRDRVQEAYHIARAKKMTEQQRWEEAYQSYHSLIATHKDTETVLTYAETALKSGHYADASDALTQLDGRYVAEYQNHRANVVGESLEKIAKEMQMPQPTNANEPAKGGPPLRLTP